MDERDLFGGGDEAEGWLVSYADMMTLIACFFILMVAFANYDPKGFSEKTKEISKHFNRDKVLKAEIKMKYMEQEFAKHPELKEKTKISIKDSELILTFSASAMFENGSYDLDEKSLRTVDSLIDIIKNDNAEYRILVEGHADDVLEKSAIKSQWVISSARSAAVIERFQYFGFPQDHLTAIAKGDSFKLMPSTDTKGNRIEKNASMNRRVMIKILEPIYKKKIKLGLGVYFEDSVDNK
ncbi:MAG: OmpA/MotB family protein [Bacteriovoracaceae bacterium]